MYVIMYFERNDDFVNSTDLYQSKYVDAFIFLDKQKNPASF